VAAGNLVPGRGSFSSADVRSPPAPQVLDGPTGPTVGWLRPGDRLVLACLRGAATTLGRGELVLLLGADAPLDLIGLRVRCVRCGQPPCDGWFDWEPDECDARSGRRRDHGGGG